MKYLMLLSLAAAMLAPFPLAAKDGHAAHGKAAPHTLSLNAGKKWDTDKPLRHAMNAMRATVARNFDLVHGGNATAATYEAAAKEVNEQVAYMVTNCKLGRKADAQLHIVLADVIGGVETLVGEHAGVGREAGLVSIGHALNTYGSHFAHPGWKPLKLAH
jgi:hypothetical protein